MHSRAARVLFFINGSLILRSSKNCEFKISAILRPSLGLAAPNLAHQQSAQPRVLPHERESRPMQGSMVVGQAADFESSKHSESSIEQPNQRARNEPAKPSFRNRELRDNPDSRIGDNAAQPRRQRATLFRRQAVEKEMRSHQIVRRILWLPFARVFATNRNPPPVCFRTAQQSAEHCGASVHGVNANLRVRAEQRRSKPPIAVTENKRVASRRKLRKKRVATPREQRTKREKLDPSVNLRHAIEVRCLLRHCEFRGCRPSEFRPADIWPSYSSQKKHKRCEQCQIGSGAQSQRRHSRSHAIKQRQQQRTPRTRQNQLSGSWVQCCSQSLPATAPQMQPKEPRSRFVRCLCAQSRPGPPGQMVAASFIAGFPPGDDCN